MDSIRFTIIENSKSKGLKKGLIIIISFIFLVVSLICLGNYFVIDPVVLVFGTMAMMIGFVVFYDNFKTYNNVGYLELQRDFLTINQGSESFIVELKDISYFDFEYKGYAGSYHPGDVVGGTIISHDGTGNILEIGTSSNIYKLNILIGDERSAIILKNYVIKLNKSKQVKD